MKRYSWVSVNEKQLSLLVGVDPKTCSYLFGWIAHLQYGFTIYLESGATLDTDNTPSVVVKVDGCSIRSLS